MLLSCLWTTLCICLLGLVLQEGEAFSTTGGTSRIRTGKTTRCWSESGNESCNHHHHHHQQQQQQQGLLGRRKGSLQRRRFLQNLLTAAAGSGLVVAPSAALAAKGAAELDAEYYLKSLFNNNLPDVSKRPDKPKAARALDLDLAQLLQDTLLKRIIEFSSVGSKDSAEVVGKATKDKIEKLIKDLGPYFQRKQPFPLDDLSNQFCFDLRSYAAFKVAAAQLVDLQHRALLVKGLGEDVYQAMDARIARETGKRVPIKDAKISDTNGIIPARAGLVTLLEEFKKTGLIRDYKISSRFQVDDWTYDQTASLELSVFEPATLAGFVQMNGEGFRFHPDFVGPALQAYLKACNVKSRYDEYLVDETYRPDPSQFVASEVLYAWELS